MVLLKSVLVLLGLLCVCHGNCFLPCSLSWEGGSLDFPSNTIRKLYIDSGKYIPKNVIATKAVVKLDKLILLTSRIRQGIPATVVSYDQRCNKGYPKFQPFPNLAMHEQGNCQAIQNAVDIFLDHMGLLWVLDSGIVNTMESPNQLCSPKVLCIAPSSGKIIKTIDLSSLTTWNTSKVQNIVTEYDNQRRGFLYISDPETKSILVYDVENAKGFRVLLPPDVTPQNVTSQDVLYLALSKKPALPSQLMFTYLSKPGIYSIKTQYLNSGKTQGRIKVAGKSESPIVFLGTNMFSRVFFRYLNESNVNVWDTTRPFNLKPYNPIYKSDDCFLPTAVVVDNFKCFKVLESNYKDYLDKKVGSGTIHQLNNIVTDISPIIKQ